MEMRIRLKNIDSVKQLVAVLDRYNCSSRLIDGKTIVDARSMMQIFVLNLSKEFMLIIDSDDLALWKALGKFRTSDETVVSSSE